MKIYFREIWLFYSIECLAFTLYWQPTGVSQPEQLLPI